MSPMIRGLGCVLLLGTAVLGGCASQPTSEQALQQAGDDFQKVKEDANVLRFAPKDVIRAGESLPAPIACPATGAAAPMWCITPT